MLYRVTAMDELKKNYNHSAELYGCKPLRDDQHMEFDYNALGGSIVRAFEQVQKHGYCPEEKLRSEAKRADGEVVALQGVISWTQKLGRDIKSGSVTVENVEEKLNSLNSKDLFVDADLSAAVANLLPHNDLVVTLAEDSCKNARKAFPADFNYELEPVDSRNWNKSFARLNQDLKMGPVALSVNDSFLYGKSQWGSSVKANHLILVTGRRWNEATERCEFRVRNSQTLRNNYTETEWYSDLDILKNSDGIYARQPKQ